MIRTLLVLLVFPPAAPSRDLTYVGDPSKWFGRTTAREISRMLEQLQKRVGE